MRTIQLTVLSTLAVAVACGAEGDFYRTPQDSPRFRDPQFISRPLTKAYPGIEYNIRPAVRGGTYPYAFSLEKSPKGMTIDLSRGTVKWTPRREGTYSISIQATDSAGKTATQSYDVAVTRTGFYFVSPDGDDANPGTVQKPWKTVVRVALPPKEFTYPAGAVVYFRGGEYKINRPPPKGKKAGVSELGGNGISIGDRAPRYWIAYPGERPVIDFGWSGEMQKAAFAEQKAAGKGRGGKRITTQRGYGHRFGLTGSPKYFYMDGFEIKNTCYYTFVMWNGKRTVHFRRCEMHHLWCDGAENPGFIFTFAGSRRGGKSWGVRAQVKAYRNFVLQDNHFHDRFMVGHHGAAFVFYTVHDSVIENNLFERLDGTAFWDKDNGLGNTYRGNVIRESGGGSAIYSQGSCDEIDISYNYFESSLDIWGHAGWVRNIWVHHNTFRGKIRFRYLSRHLKEKIDATKGDFSKETSDRSVAMVRDYPAEKRFVHFYRNVLKGNPKDRRLPNVVTVIQPGKRFAEDWRRIRWDENVIDSQAKVAMGRQVLELTFLKRLGMDAKGIQAPVVLDENGKLPIGSPWIGKYGWEVGENPKAIKKISSAGLPAQSVRGKKKRPNLNSSVERTASKLYRMARAAQRQGKPDMARQIFNQIARDFPGTKAAQRATFRVSEIEERP